MHIHLRKPTVIRVITLSIRWQHSVNQLEFPSAPFYTMRIIPCIGNSYLTRKFESEQSSIANLNFNEKNGLASIL